MGEALPSLHRWRNVDHSGSHGENDFWTIIFAAIRWASLLDGYERDGIIDDAVS